MFKFQITEDDLHYHEDWEVGEWAVYQPGARVYYFRKTEEEADQLLLELREDNEKLRTAR